MKEIYSAPDMEIEVFDTVVMSLISGTTGNFEEEDDLG